jgi:hypothetical protein
MAVDSKHCGKPMLRLGKVGRLVWYQCLKCKALFTVGIGSKRFKRQKDYECGKEGCK